MRLLSIDTAGETATIGLGNETEVIGWENNTDQKQHASFLQPAIQRLLQSTSVSFQDIAAVAVVNGPGSYTGLRVGLASAKGICYALQKPLITLNTLTVMAYAAIEKWKDSTALYCPLIDARRNEVFTALYNADLTPLLLPQPLILEPNSFSSFFQQQKIIFFGSGHNKCEKLISYKNAFFDDVTYSIHHINILAQAAFQKGDFADIAYEEPFYTKEFYLSS